MALLMSTGSVRAMFGEHPALEESPVESRAARAVHMHILRDTFLHSGRRHDDFKNRARSKLRLNGFIQQRVVVTSLTHSSFEILTAK